MGSAISIVIPLYNKARYISRALDSVLGQIHQDFEVVVVNDGSTDGSEDIVRRYADPRVRLIHREHVNSEGGHAARNLGIAESRADLVAFLDADDEWLPEHLATIVRLSERYPECGAYATAYEIVDGQHRRRRPAFSGIPPSPWEGVIPDYFCYRLMPVCSSSVAVPKRVFGSVGLFPEGVGRSGDSYMWWRIALKYRMSASTRTGAVYHHDAGNRAGDRYTVAQLRDREQHLSKLINDALRSGGLPQGVTPDGLIEYRNERSIAVAYSLAATGNAVGARELLRAAISTRRHRLMWIRVLALSFVPESMQTALRQIIRRSGAVSEVDTAPER